MGTGTTVVDSGKLSWHLTYQGTEVKTNDIAKIILTRATVELVKVLKDKKLNAVLLSIFKAQDVLQDTETESLHELNITTTEWAIIFLKLLGERYDKSQALHLLCNLNHDQLINYQPQIHEAFEKSPNYPDVKVVCDK